MLLAAFEPSPLPFAALMGLGFLVGAAGHLYKSPATVAVGIGIVFLATLLVPLAFYVNDR
jgi:hypothetical protein